MDKEQPQEGIARYASYAEASLVKDKRINLRISSRDLEDIARAAEEGIPYQTLMAIAGKLPSRLCRKVCTATQ
ncbi:MAG: hypothetical protein ACREU8_03425 [Gammaproteobacteria bacterium]